MNYNSKFEPVVSDMVRFLDRIRIESLHQDKYGRYWAIGFDRYGTPYRAYPICCSEDLPEQFSYAE